MSEVKFMEKDKNFDIGVYISEFNGKEFLHIREHYFVARTGERKPSKKGVALSIAKAVELHALLSTVLSEAGVHVAAPEPKAKAAPKAKPAPKATRRKSASYETPAELVALRAKFAESAVSD